MQTWKYAINIKNPGVTSKNKAIKFHILSCTSEVDNLPSQGISRDVKSVLCVGAMHASTKFQSHKTIKSKPITDKFDISCINWSLSVTWSCAKDCRNLYTRPIYSCILESQTKACLAFKFSWVCKRLDASCFDIISSLMDMHATGFSIEIALKHCRSQPRRML